MLKELAKIRKNFARGLKLDAYSRRKYTWKIIYIYMLGYEVNIGHMEAMRLVASKSYAEKKCGYTASQVLFNENHELLTMLTQPVKNDLNRAQPEHFQALAMTLVANVGSKTMADTLWKDVAELLTYGGSRSSIRKKACLSLLRMICKSPENIEVESIAPRIVEMIGDHDFGVSLCATTLMIGLVSLGDNPAFAPAVPITVRLLYKLVTKSTTSHDDYLYQGRILSPWLQVKCLRLLQYFPAPRGDALRRLDLAIKGILNNEKKRVAASRSRSKTSKQNSKNADHAVLFEMMNLVIHYERLAEAGDESKEMYRKHLEAISALLGRFIALKEANTRYLGLDAMSRLAQIEGMGPKIAQQMTTILFSLHKDLDSSIRKRALDLLYVICDKDNSRKITQELLDFLRVADYKIREELVLKIAILAEKFATDLRWYLDVILKLITRAGNFVSEEIWYRAIQIITNNEKLHKYAALVMYQALQDDTPHGGI